MITVHREADYVRIEVTGSTTLKELITYAQNNVGTWLSDPVLWDMTQATLAEDRSDFAAVQGTVKSIHALAEKRKGQKTTFVAHDPVTYGMLRMALTIVESLESRLVASVFSHMQEAEAWLNE